MSEKITQVHHTSKDELIRNIIKGVENKLKEFEKSFTPKEPTTWLTKKEVSIILSISIVTIDDWSKKGILSPYRIGNRIRFKRIDIENALTNINKK
ncbi:MAG: helix-turn-helix domain-containing protein [Lutibacter sp.]|uniref:helix-turn-helix domain-containing protein n=1 Tax=Lutibacter sp. TaxID=1925666 RepID=UPI00299D4999|nr:helix-turn-helix domain-containing protein [Lutibacter sp.]MDX1828768.1 helix-turn-helix domain-containing protein [Lutibacter sp.]